MEIDATELFNKIWNSNKRIIVLRGGTRSSKTYTTCQYCLIRALKYPNTKIVIARATLASAKNTVIKTLKEVINSSDMFYEFKENKSSNTFIHPNGSEIKFIPCDDEYKIRGIEANIFWLEEANEIPFKIFKQFILRMTSTKQTKENQMILSFNPSSPRTWIKQHIEDKRTDYDLFKTTYRDNPFLDDESIREIEYLKESNPDEWKIYGEGNYTEVKGAIINNFETVEEFPDTKDYSYGIDWGFTVDPTSLVKVAKIGDKIYVEQLIYENNLTNPEIMDRLRDYKLNRTNEIIADSAEPKTIKEFYNSGFFIKGVRKGKDSIKFGLDILKRYKICIVENHLSHYLLEELYNYKWKEDREGNSLQIPIDAWNHSIDSIRYVCMEKFSENKRKVKITIGGL